MTDVQQTTEARVDGYEAALLEYLAGSEEHALLRGYDLGRNALSDGVGLLQIVTMHSRAVAAALNGAADEKERQRLVDAETTFLIEALSPFEMARRAFYDSNAVLRRLNEVLEAQAKRIAYALHNEAGQLLASVHFALADAGRELPAEKAKHLEDVRTMLIEIESRLRNLSHELRPPVLDDIGLSGALDLVAQGISSRWGLPVIVSVSLETDIPAAIENTIYRIVQEALANVAKHASANRAEVRVQQTARKVVCSVRDDGTGFDDTAGFRKGRPGLGMTEIRERVGALGGTVRLSLNKKGGTDLTIEIPLDR
jgi:signal transduction histidine kinase